VQSEALERLEELVGLRRHALRLAQRGDVAAALFVIGSLEDGPHPDLVSVTGAELDPVHELVTILVPSVVHPVCDRASEVAIVRVLQQGAVDVHEGDAVPAEWVFRLERGEAVGVCDEPVAAGLLRVAVHPAVQPGVSDLAARTLGVKSDAPVVVLDLVQHRLERLGGLQLGAQLQEAASQIVRGVQRPELPELVVPAAVEQAVIGGVPPRRPRPHVGFETDPPYSPWVAREMRDDRAHPMWRRPSPRRVHREQP